MSDTPSLHNVLSPIEMAKHLRKPEGETGKQVGQHMNIGNKHICLNSYALLAPLSNSRILEIGMGNGLFIKDLLQLAEGITYIGIDYSQTMVDEATELNKELISSGQVSFSKASIEKLPLQDNSFDYITTTNTIYFWPEPAKNIQESRRVLKPGGKILIAYRPKSFMDKLELTQYGFTKYDVNEVEGLLLGSGFSQISTKLIVEPEKEIIGKRFSMEGYYTLAVKI